MRSTSDRFSAANEGSAVADLFSESCCLSGAIALEIGAGFRQWRRSIQMSQNGQSRICTYSDGLISTASLGKTLAKDSTASRVRFPH